MFKFEYVYKRLLLASFFLGLFAAVGGSPAGASGLCTDAIPVDLNATVRGFAADEQSRHRLEVETPGIVTLEVAAAGETAVRARLGLLSARYDLIVIEESATHLAFAVRRAGSFCVRVAAQDPRRPLGSYKLTAHFVEAEVREQELAWEHDWLRAVETTFYATGIRSKVEDHEVDPDPSRVELGQQALVSLVTLKGAAALKAEDHEVDPDPVRVDLEAGRILARVVLLHGGDDLLKMEDHEVDPDPVRVHVEPGRLIRFAAVGGSSAELRAAAAEERAALVTWIAGLIWPELPVANDRFRLLAYGALEEAPLLRPELGGRCRRDEPDDHGDTFACATPVALGRRISAEIGNGWGDDEDVYRFRLSEMAAVAVEAVGEADFAIALYDRFGQRLETAGGDRALIVRTLSPGEYFVRVAGGGAGSYEFSLTGRGW